MPRGRFTSLWGLPLLLLLLPLLLLLLPDRAHGFGFGFGGGDKGKEKQKEADAAAAPKAPKLPKGPPPQVEILTEANFWEQTGDGSTWLVDFYAPWCGHCVKLNPILDELAPLVGAQHGLRIGKVDATQQGKIAKEFGVTGYPTLKILQPGFEAATPDGEPAPGTVTDYEGPRSKEAFITLAERMAAPSPRLLSTPEEFGSFQRAHPVAFLLALPAPEKKGKDYTALETAYTHVAHGLKASADFALVRGPAALAGQAEGVFRPTPFLAKLEHGEAPLFFPLDNPPISEEALRRWAVGHNRRLVSKLEAHNFRRLGQMGKLMAIAVVDPSDAAGAAAFVDRLREVGRAQQGLVEEHFVLGHLDGVRWKGFVGQFGIQPNHLPRLFVLDFPSEKFYYDPEVDEADEMETFLLDIAGGKVPAQRQGGLGQAASMIWTRLAEWYPWSLGLMFPIGMLLALCLFPNIIMESDEEERLRAPQERQQQGAGSEEGAGAGAGEAAPKDAASKKNE